MQRYIRESCTDSVVEEHLAQKPGRNVGLHRLADDEAVIDESISDVANHRNERYKGLPLSGQSDSGERGWLSAGEVTTHRVRRSIQSGSRKC